MSRYSGFVPIRYKLAGKLLLIAGLVGLGAVGTSALTGWFALPPAILYLCLAAIPVGLYLLYVVPEEPRREP